MGLLDSIVGGIGGLSSIVGMIQSNRARDEAMRQQQQALSDYSAALGTQYNNLLGNQNRTLMGMAGQGGDAIRSLGANLGSSLAGAGVWNSSATAGALAQAQRDENAALANLAAENYSNAGQFRNQGLANLAQMRLGLAGQNYTNANADLSGARQGLFSFLGSLAQTNLARSGANTTRSQLPAGKGANPSGNAGATPSVLGLASSVLNPRNYLGGTPQNQPLGQITVMPKSSLLGVHW